jgi:hypothetical protein
LRTAGSALFFVEGSGEITIGGRTWPLTPGSYDPPRVRA